MFGQDTGCAFLRLRIDFLYMFVAHSNTLFLIMHDFSITNTLKFKCSIYKIRWNTMEHHILKMRPNLEYLKLFCTKLILVACIPFWKSQSQETLNNNNDKIYFNWDIRKLIKISWFIPCWLVIVVVKKIIKLFFHRRG